MGDDGEQRVADTTAVPDTPEIPQQEDAKPMKDDDTVPEDNEPPKEAVNKKLLNLRFLFANRDGLSVSIQCDPSDTVGEVKGALISVWPKGMSAIFWRCSLIPHDSPWLTQKCRRVLMAMQFG